MSTAFLPVLLAAQLAGPSAGPTAPPANDDPAARVPWQQQVHYTIEATLDEDAQRLMGAGTLVYENHSPDALDEIYFHLHLNAFRPNSVWARAEQREQYDFQSLEDPDYAYERLGSMRMGDAALVAEYPYAPDSSVVRFALPRTIEPGASATFSFEWAARPSTLCRRQCRQGRSWDFAQWYPRVAVYDPQGWRPNPLHPQGEFYGEFGAFDVTLDLAADQVVGATGVVLEGDPGWVPGPGSPLSAADLNSNAYPNAVPAVSPGFFDGTAAAGRKRVRFYGEDIHHFAWSTSPDYRYETGRWKDVDVHVLSRPEDEDWRDGVVVDRSIRALEWLETVFGTYPYPQITNVHRIEGGGTEFPMMVMNGGPSQGLITHEFAHQYAMGIFGSNEWQDAWMDEGMASFLASWFSEETEGADPFPRSMMRVGMTEARGVPVPAATLAHEMPDFGTYNYLAYTKPSMVYYMLREYLGTDVMRAGLQLYFERNAFRHVVEEDLRGALEDASGQDLEWFFAQWIRSTATLDWAVTSATTTRGSNGWETRVVLTRTGEAWMPVVVEAGDARTTVDSRDRTVEVTLISSTRPEAAVADPDVILIDVDRENNRVEVTGGDV